MFIFKRCLIFFLAFFCSFFLGGGEGGGLAPAPKQVNEGNYAFSQAAVLHIEVVSQEIHNDLGEEGEK